MLYMQYSWSVFTAPIVAEKLSWLTVAVFKTIIATQTVM